jgi:hypothetical protein
VKCKVLDLRKCVHEAFDLSANGAASLGDCFVKFRHSLVASLLKVDVLMENEAEVDITVTISITEEEIS